MATKQKGASRGNAFGVVLACIAGCLVTPTGCGGRAKFSMPEPPPAAAGTSGTGGQESAAGATSSAGSPPAGADSRACSSDSDCQRCLYAIAPSSVADCANAIGCCGGPILNSTTCAANYAAWLTNCSGVDRTAPQCPCIACTGAITCTDGQCGFTCDPG